MINKQRAIKIGITAGFIVIALLVGAVADGYFSDENGYFKPYNIIFPAKIKSYIESMIGVTKVVEDGSGYRTNIYVDPKVDSASWTKVETQIDAFAERSKINLALTTTLSGSPLPLCLIDRVTGVKSGIYLDNGKLTVQAGDPLCA